MCDDYPDIEITADLRKSFFTEMENVNRSIQTLRSSLWWIRGSGILFVVGVVWAILTSRLIEFLPGGGLRVANLRTVDALISLVIVIVAASILLYCAVQCAKRLKREQMGLQNMRKAGIHYRLISD